MVFAAAFIALPSSLILTHGFTSGKLTLFGINITDVRLMLLDQLRDIGVYGLAANRLIPGSIDNITELLFAPVMFSASFLLLVLSGYIILGIFSIVYKSKKTAPEAVTDRFPLTVKYRIAGAFLSILSGLFIGTFVFLPVSNFSSVIHSNKSAMAMIISKDNLEILTAFKHSPADKIYMFTGTKTVGRIVFRKLTSVKSNGQRIDIYEETENIAKVATFLTNVSNPRGYYSKLCQASTEVTEIYFNTAVISESEDDRFELLIRILRKTFNDSDVLFLKNIANGLNYDDKKKLLDDLHILVKVTALLEENQIMDSTSDYMGTYFSAFSNIDKGEAEEIADLLYGMEISDGITRALLSSMIGAVLKDTAYQYPDHIDLRGTMDDFVELLQVMPRIAVVLDSDSNISRLSDEKHKKFVDDVNLLKTSPLLPPEVFSKISEMVKNNL
jgi:hypothetical protein